MHGHKQVYLVSCRDLLEVCEAQLQFGSKAELPVFGGSRGPDISKSMTDIQVGTCRLNKFAATMT